MSQDIYKTRTTKYKTGEQNKQITLQTTGSKQTIATDSNLHQHKAEHSAIMHDTANDGEELYPDERMLSNVFISKTIK